MERNQADKASNQGTAPSMTFSGPDRKAITSPSEQKVLSSLSDLLKSRDGVCLLKPSRPLERNGILYSAMNWMAADRGTDINIQVFLVSSRGSSRGARSHTMPLAQAKATVQAFFRGSPPDINGWTPVHFTFPMNDHPANGLRTYEFQIIDSHGERKRLPHFGPDDVQIAGEYLEEGKYQMAEFTLHNGHPGLRVSANRWVAGFVTVIAAKKEGNEIRYLSRSCPATQGTNWLMAFYRGNFQPEGPLWGDVTQRILTERR